MNTSWGTGIEFVLRMEGGLTDDPNDPGGLTNFGISQKAYPQIDIEKLTVDQAKDIYKKDYWEACKCDELPFPFDIAVFDCAVNQGVGKARRLLQIALNVQVDGIIGDSTIAAAFKATPGIFKKMLAERISEYLRLMIKNNSLLIFAKNWIYRVLSLQELILKQPC